MEHTEKFKGALNILAERRCRTSNAYDINTASETLKHLTDRGTPENVVIAYFCALAYGVENISLKDAELLVDYGLLRKVRNMGKSLDSNSTYAKLTDVLVAHWKDFSAEEKVIIADAITEKSEVK